MKKDYQIPESKTIMMVEFQEMCVTQSAVSGGNHEGFTDGEDYEGEIVW